jgi:hypothetical protein
MDTLNINLTPEMLALVPVVAVILEALKRISILEKLKPWMPFISIGVALGLGYLTGIVQPIMPSIIIGLVASGGYDLLKSPSKAT